jgi:hypothetical protein
MPVAFVILAFFVGGFLGLLTSAMARAAHDAEVSLRVERDDGLLSTGDTSKRN